MKPRFLTVAVVAILLLGGLAYAADGLPGGKWWNRPEVVKELGLSNDQRSKLDAIFRSSAPALIDLKAEVDKRNIDLRTQLDQEQLNKQAIQAAASKLSDARAKLFERELMMLVDMRGVLTADQWGDFRDKLEGPGRMGRGPEGGPPPRDRRRPPDR